MTARSWLGRHGRSLAVLLPTLVVSAAVHALGAGSYPGSAGGPSTHLSQAWSLRYDDGWSLLSYVGGQAPSGWVQVALWSVLTGGSDRHDSALSFGNECMLIAKVASVGLLFVLGRRLGFGRVAAATAGMLFALCPLALAYSRWTILENLATPWLLLSFVLALSGRRGVTGGTGAGLALGMASLTHGAALVVLPALAWLLHENRASREGTSTPLTLAVVGSCVLGMSPLLARLPGELLARGGHLEAVGVAGWQLSGWTADRSVLDPSSQVRVMVDDWLSYDWALPVAGLLAAVVCTGPRRLRPVVLALALQLLVVIGGGQVPFVRVVTLLPWCALLAAGAVEVILGNPSLWAGGRHRIGNGLPAAPVLLRGYLAAVAVLGFLAVVAVPWGTSLHQMTTSRPRLASDTTVERLNR